MIGTCTAPYCATPPLRCCWGGCCPLFLYIWRRDPLLCYHYRWGRCGLFLIRLAARSFTVLPPLHSYWAILNCVTSLHCTLVKCCLFSCNGRRGVGRPFTVLPPYTAPKLNAACFRAMSVGVLGDSQLCYPTTLHLG